MNERKKKGEACTYKTTGEDEQEKEEKGKSEGGRGWEGWGGAIAAKMRRVGDGKRGPATKWPCPKEANDREWPPDVSLNNDNPSTLVSSVPSRAKLTRAYKPNEKAWTRITRDSRFRRDDQRLLWKVRHLYWFFETSSTYKPTWVVSLDSLNLEIAR